MRKLREKVEPGIRQLSPQESIDEVIVKFKENREIVKTLSPVIVEQISALYVKEKELESEVKGRIAILRDILLAWGEATSTKVVGKTTFGDRNLPPQVEPIKIAEFILSQQYEKAELHRIFNAVFSVSITEFKKYFGQEALVRCGAKLDKKEYAEIRISKK